MSPAVNLTEFSEDELTDLIKNAGDRRDELRQSREHEAATGLYGSKGQDVRNPNHGAISAPTPNEVKRDGPAHGVTDTVQSTG